MRKYTAFMMCLKKKNREKSTTMLTRSIKNMFSKKKKKVQMQCKKIKRSK